MPSSIDDLVFAHLNQSVVAVPNFDEAPIDEEGHFAYVARERMDHPLIDDCLVILLLRLLLDCHHSGSLQILVSCVVDIMLLLLLLSLLTLDYVHSFAMKVWR